jgi:hypothetical protein
VWPESAALTHELALTLSLGRECLRPIAASRAQTFRDTPAGENGHRVNPAQTRSPLEATPYRAAQPQPYAGKAWRAYRNPFPPM